MSDEETTLARRTLRRSLLTLAMVVVLYVIGAVTWVFALGEWRFPFFLGGMMIALSEALDCLVYRE